MLKNATVSAITLLTTKVGDAGVHLTPMAESPLAGLVGRCYNPVLDIKVDGQGMTDQTDAMSVVYDLAQKTREPTLNDAPNHGDAVDDFVGVLAKTVEANLHATRNIVKPMILDVATFVDNARRQAAAPLASVLAVVPDAYEDIWSSTGLDDLVKNFKEIAALSNVDLFNIHPLRTKEEVLDMMRTGSSRFDGELSKWAAEVGDEFIYDTYRQYFSNSIGADEEAVKHGFALQYVLGSGKAERQRALVIHLIARRLRNEVPEGVDMSLSEYQLLMAGIIEQTGRAICRVFEARERDRSMRRMILSWPQQGAEYEVTHPEYAQILVNPDLYTEWLEQGGTPEVLYGSFITDRNDGMASLIERKEQYETAWMRRSALVRSRQRSDLFNVSLSAYRAALTNKINSLTDDCVPNGTRAPMHARLNELLDDIGIDQTERVYDTSKWLVCRVMFNHTDSLRILDALDGVAKDNPELADRPMEAALLATIDILVDWLSRQIDVNNCV